MVNIKRLDMTIGKRDRNLFPGGGMDNLDVLPLETVLLNKILNSFVGLGEEFILADLVGILPRLGANDSVDADGVMAYPHRVAETKVICGNSLSRPAVFGRFESVAVSN